MNHLIVTCHINNYDLEIVSDFFFKIGCLGTELIESDFINKEFTDHFGELYTLNKCDYPDMGVIIKGYFEETLDELNLKNQIERFLYNMNVEILNGLFEITLKEAIDYSNSWKDQYEEIMINETISIIPSWFEAKENKLFIKIEPGLGFGTGSHPTTQMCLKHLANFIQIGNDVCDLGTGSGVIAILAKKCGAKRVYGIDLDLDALKNAIHNASLNQISDITWTSSGLDQLNIKNNIIVANIIYDVIIQLLPDITKSLKESGLLILSGITKNQKDDIINKLVEFDYQLIKVEENKDFVSFVCRK